MPRRLWHMHGSSLHSLAWPEPLSSELQPVGMTHVALHPPCLVLKFARMGGKAEARAFALLQAVSNRFPQQPPLHCGVIDTRG